MYKIVLFPISVPTGKYCWQHHPPFHVCEYFDNEGGYGECILNLGDLKPTDKGVLKAHKCLKLKEK